MSIEAMNERIRKLAEQAGSTYKQSLGVYQFYTNEFEKFAELIRADEREKLAKWMMEQGYATGHGDTLEDLLKEIKWQVEEREREACAKVAESYEPLCDSCPSGVATAIRARGEA